MMNWHIFSVCSRVFNESLILYLALIFSKNIFYGKKVTKVFDLKGSLRGRFAKNLKTNYPDNSDNGANESSCDEAEETRRKKKAQKQNNRSNNFDLDAASDVSSHNSSEDEDLSQSESKDSRKMTPNGNDGSNNSEVEPSLTTLLDGDFLEYTMGRPLPLSDKAKALFHMSILNVSTNVLLIFFQVILTRLNLPTLPLNYYSTKDTLFLSIINVLDYSILVGIDEENMELVVGIIDFMRQYDILKQMERVGKSLPMVVGQEAPTIIQPPLYKARFINAMEKYFMTVPNKWTSI